MAKNRSNSPTRREFLEGVGVSSVALIIGREALAAAEGWDHLEAAALQNVGQAKEEFRCAIYPVFSPAYTSHSRARVSAQRDKNRVTLANGLVAVQVSLASGVVVGVTNKVTRQNYSLADDQAGFTAKLNDRERVEWLARAGARKNFAVSLENRTKESIAVLVEESGGVRATIEYRLGQDQFWIERRIKIESAQPNTKLEKLVYGKLELPGSRANMLKLGKFDRPLILSHDSGGAFAGVGWWFYSVDDQGVYQNNNLSYPLSSAFQSEPWYLGVFRAEEGEPYPGWLWYKQFLQMRKASHDKQTSWSYWNAGWGQWGIDIDSPSAPPYIDLIDRLNVRGICFGEGLEGKGIPAYIELGRNSQIAKKNLAKLKVTNIAGGSLESGGLKEKWEDAAVIEQKFKQLNDYVKEGFKAYHFDFFDTVDTFPAHRNVSKYFRAAHDQLDYTECHLGMADYGPQFQREVLINHPNDLHGFDISHFSSDWTTFLGFRHSRREWQERYQYLMPEYGLYYYLTHYSNWGHARQYTDPEPQQFLYGPHSYCGIAYNFHDVHGFRDVLLAASAFSPYSVFGHLELKMPERDVAFTRAYFEWVEENIDVLTWSRVCLETEDACVISKIRDGRGAIFLLNYGPGKRTFKLTLQKGNVRNHRIQPVYPARLNVARRRSGETLEVSVRGESVTILNVNGGLKTLPPQNASAFPIDVLNWQQRAGSTTASVFLPKIDAQRAKNPDIPAELLSLEQIGKSVIGRGKLPDQFLKTFDFKDGKIAKTWKFAPWAYADKVWLVYRPAKLVPLSSRLPSAKVNGSPVKLIPRVDYRSKKVEEWSCPLFFADVTEVCKYQQNNSITLSGLNEDKPSTCYITTSADRY